MARTAETIAIVFVALVLIAGLAPRSSARLLDVQAQFRYDLRMSKQAGMEPVGNGRFSTNYSLGIRRPLFASTSLLADLNLSSYTSSENADSQSSTNSTLKLYYQKPKYDLLARISRNQYQSEFASQSSTGFSTNYNASLFVREPAYPVVNLQYLRNTSGSALAGSQSTYAVSTWMLGMYHDLAPFRFTYDRTQQLFGYSGSAKGQTTTQRSSVTLDRTLLPGLAFSGELSKNNISLGSAGGNTAETMTDRALVRLTATPARAVAASVTYSTQSNNSSRSSRRDTRTGLLSTSVRAEILPGLSLDYAADRQSQTSLGIIGGAFGSVDNRIALSARLSEQAYVTASMLRSKYDTGIPASDSSNKAFQLSLQSALTPRTDFTASYQTDTSSQGLVGRYDSSFVGLSLRDHTTQDLSLGLAGRRNRVRSVPAGGQAFSIFSNSVDLDALWLATNDLSIDLRLGWHADSGFTAYRVLSPSYSVRYQITPATGLSVNYDVQSFQQRDAIGFWLPGYRTKNVSLHLTHAYRSGASIDLSYDFASSGTGPTEWQKLIRAYVTTRL